MNEHSNIHEAIIGVMGEVGYMQKQTSDKLPYTFAGEAALIKKLRPAMIDHGIYAFVKDVQASREQFTTKLYADGKGGTLMNITLLRGTVRFTHAPSNTHIDVAAMGEGADVGDKSANKAATGLLKYALRQTFLIETGDDPDEHNSEGMERSEPTVQVEDL